MTSFNFKQSIKSIALAAATLGCVVSTPQVAQAAELFEGWNYAIDSFNDGTEYSKIGDDSAFEFYGLAYQETADSVIFAFNSNLDLDGWQHGGAEGGAVGYGDMFIRFGDGNFADAEGTNDLYAVNFSDNDSNLDTGLYSNVTSQSLTHKNLGYSSIQSHTNRVANLGGSANHGDLAADDAYFNKNAAARTHIQNGTYESGITMLDSFEGLNFGHFGANGSNTYGFSIDKSQLKMGSFVANFFAECGNDGIAIAGELTGLVETPQDPDTRAVPESSPMAGLIVVGMMAGGAAMRKRRNVA